jgi:hypothetical protein
MACKVVIIAVGGKPGKPFLLAIGKLFGTGMEKTTHQVSNSGAV